MKKLKFIKSFFFGLLSILILFTSCTSIPKTVGEDDTLTIGEFKLSASGYEKIDFNSKTLVRAEITIQDTIMGKKYSTYTDKNGFYSFANLPPSHTFKITQIKIRSQNGGEVWINDPNFKTFTPLLESVVNLGQIKMDFDGKKNWVQWQFIDLISVEDDFRQMNLNTQWYSKQVIDYPIM